MANFLLNIRAFVFIILIPVPAWSQTNLGDSLVECGMKYLDLPYRSATIESSDYEKCIIQTHFFDCYTFVERALAETLDPHHPEAVIPRLRYRNVTPEGYCSRLHYLSDWLLTHINGKLLSDVTPGLPGAVEIKFKVNFMSKHPKLYPAMQRDSCQNLIEEIEARLSKKTFYYLPKYALDQALSQIRNGDIIAITTHKKGLDYSHLGIAMVKNGVPYLLHASSDVQKVTLSKRTLKSYLLRNKLQTGISVFRLNP